MAAIKRLTAWTSSNSHPDSSSITIPAGSDRLLISVGISGTYDLFGGVAAAGSPTGMKYWDEAQLAAMGASEVFHDNSSAPSGGLKTYYAFFENIDQVTPFDSGQSGTSSSLTWNYSGLEPSRLAVGRSFVVGNETLSAGGSTNPLTKHFELHWTISGGARTAQLADNLSTNVVDDVFDEDYPASGSYTLSSTAATSYSHRINVFNGKGTNDFAATVAATSIVTPALDTQFTFASTTNVASTVAAGLQTGRAFMSSTVVQSALVVAELHNTSVRYESTTNVVSTVTPVLAIEKVLASTTTAVSTVSNFLSALPFPTVTQRITGTSTASLGTHSFTLPDHEAGDRIMIIFAHGGWPWPDLAPESVTHGWRNMWWQDNGGGSNIATIIATGSNSETGTLIFEPETFGTPLGTAYIGLTIENANNIAIQSSEWPADGGEEYWTPYTFANLDITNVKPVLWIAAVGGTTNYTQQSEGVGPADDWSMQTAPTNYSNLTKVTSGIDLPFQSTAERLLLGSSEKPSNVIPSPQNGSYPIVQVWTVAVWSDERNESSHTWSFGDRIAAFTETTVADIDGWVHNEVVTSGSANDAPAYITTWPEDISGAYFTAGHYQMVAGAGAGTLDSYTEWSGTFEDLDVPAGSRILGYAGASLHYLFPVYGGSLTTAYIGDDLGGNGALYINDGTIRTLIPDIADPTTTKTVTRVENSPAITGLDLPSDTAITLRINTHAETTASDSLYTIGLDEIKITMEILPPVQFQTTVAVTSTVAGELDRQPTFASTTNVVSTVTPDLGRIQFFDTTITATSLVTAARDLPPQVAATSTGNESTRTASHSITLPTHSEGQMLVAIFNNEQWDNGAGDAERQAWPHIDTDLSTDGWVYAGESQQAVGFWSRVATSVFWKTANSASETLTLATGNSNSTYDPDNIVNVVSSHVCYAIDGADRLEAWFESNNFVANDPPAAPSLTDSPGNIPYLSIVACGSRSTNIATSAPTGWENLISVTQAEANLVTAQKEFDHEDQIDPGTFGGIIASGESVVCNIVIWDYKPATPRRFELGHVQLIPFYDSNLDTFDDRWRISSTESDNNFTIARYSTTIAGSGVGNTQAELRFAGSVTSEDGFWEWLGTFEDLGLPADKIIREFHKASLWWESKNYVSGSGYVGDLSGKGALEMRHSSGSWVLIPNQTTVSSDTSWAKAVQFNSITGLEIPSDEIIAIRVHTHINASSDLNLNVKWPTFEVEFTELIKHQTTVGATSSVSAALSTTRTLIATVASASTVTGNIDETRKLMGTTVAQSALITSAFDRTREIASTTNVASTVAANLGLTVFFNSDTDAVSTVNPHEFFYGFETFITATSTCGATLEVDRPHSTVIAAQSTVDTSSLERTVNWASTTDVATALFANIERDVPFIADVNASTSMEGAITLAGRFATAIAVQSTVDPTELERVRGYHADIDVVSESHGNIVEGLRFLSLTVAQSAIINANLERAVDWSTTVPVVSSLTVSDFERDIEWATSLAAVTTVDGTIVVITNTLLLTLTEGDYFVEVSDRVLRLTSVSEDSVHTLNEVLGFNTVTVTEDIGTVRTPITTDN